MVPTSTDFMKVYYFKSAQQATLFNILLYSKVWFCSRRNFVLSTYRRFGRGHVQPSVTQTGSDVQTEREEKSCGETEVRKENCAGGSSPHTTRLPVIHDSSSSPHHNNCRPHHNYCRPHHYYCCAYYNYSCTNSLLRVV